MIGEIIYDKETSTKDKMAASKLYWDKSIIGASEGVTEEAVAPIRAMLREHRPAVAVVGKGVDLMRDWAQQSMAAGAIGDQLSSIVIPADIREGWTFDYHTAHPTATLHHPIFVDATGRGSPFATRLQITQEGARP